MRLTHADTYKASIGAELKLIDKAKAAKKETTRNLTVFTNGLRLFGAKLSDRKGYFDIYAEIFGGWSFLEQRKAQTISSAISGFKRTK